MRDDIGRAAAGLARPAPALYACYSSAIADFCDAENILFYNVGCARFRGIGTDEVIFERSLAEVMYPDGSASAYPHKVLYSTAVSQQQWKPAEVVVTWDAPLLLATSGRVRLDVASVWLQIKTAASASPSLSISGAYGLRLEIHGPNPATVTLLSVLKTAFDGAVASLHSYRGNRLDDCVKRLTIVLNADPSAIADKLASEAFAPLGPREVVRPYRTNVQWNPADDLCLRGEFVRKYSPNWRLVGELFTLAPHGRNSN